MDERDLPRRVVRTGSWLAALFVFLFTVGGRPDIAAGLAVGSALSLFSLLSLVWLVPRLVSPERPRVWLLGFALLAKLPVFGVVLYLALSAPAIEGLAVFAGVGLVPAVIVLKTLGRMLVGPTTANEKPGARVATSGAPDTRK